MDQTCQITDQNEFAFTARCPRDGQLQLGFGNIALLMTMHEFGQLLLQVEDTLTRVQQQGRCPCCRNIIINTSVSNMVFMFSLQELGLLHEVMQRTSILLEANGIINSKQS